MLKICNIELFPAVPIAIGIADFRRFRMFISLNLLYLRNLRELYFRFNPHSHFKSSRYKKMLQLRLLHNFKEQVLKSNAH